MAVGVPFLLAISKVEEVVVQTRGGEIATGRIVWTGSAPVPPPATPGGGGVELEEITGYLMTQEATGAESAQTANQITTALGLTGKAKRSVTAAKLSFAVQAGRLRTASVLRAGQHRTGYYVPDSEHPAASGSIRRPMPDTIRQISTPPEGGCLMPDVSPVPDAPVPTPAPAPGAPREPLSLDELVPLSECEVTGYRVVVELAKMVEGADAHAQLADIGATYATMSPAAVADWERIAAQTLQRIRRAGAGETKH